MRDAGGFPRFSRSRLSPLSPLDPLRLRGLFAAVADHVEFGIGEFCSGGTEGPMRSVRGVYRQREQGAYL